MPCLTFFWDDINDVQINGTSQVLSHSILPVIMDTIIKGDPRASVANIMWIALDTTTWIRNPSTSQTDKLAVEIVLEKDVVKRSGDAWRVVMDSCLPVIHLIDTTCSTPNAINQVQEFLGISAAFNQAVQRLSTSVSMVTKGIVQEHLILLANSMTYSGNMIGFNSGGIKALARSAHVPAPFAEATLFTPKKCFERAAEKGHVDSLSSIVASCSWGKQVSVGTGSRFDLLWDKREVGKSPQEEIDVFDFLHLIRSSSNSNAVKSACIGTDIDDLDMDYDDEEVAMSPEPGADKLTFQDALEFQNATLEAVRDLGHPNDNWGKKSSAGTENNRKDWEMGNDGNWGSKTGTSAKTNVWSSWGTDSAQKGSTLERSLSAQSTEPAANAWGSSQKDESTGGKPWGTSCSIQASWDAKATAQEPSAQSSWENIEKTKEKDSAGDSWGSGKRSERIVGKKWGAGDKQTSRDSIPPAMKSDSQYSWGVVPVPTEDAPGKEKESAPNSWGSANRAEPTGGKEWGSGQKLNSSKANQFSWGTISTQKQDTTGKQWAGKEKDSVSNMWGSNRNEPSGGKEWGGSDRPTSWSQPRRFNNPKRGQIDSPCGWGSSGAGEWKQKASGLVTATRQRLDMFTSEEQEILQVIEPIMLSIRRIMHQSGYNDGDPFSADDQTYILDNVFNNHPEKTAKMGVGIDHIMVNKHSSFQDSRCLYVVQTDGHQEDFSYRKCLENFVKTKFPELAEEFNAKYFKKPHPRFNRDQSVGLDEASGKQVAALEDAGRQGGGSEEPSRLLGSRP